MIDSLTLARAFRSASDAAYRAVRKPVEGTMLTVIRELAEEAEAQARPDLPVADLLRALVRRGEDALARTPQHLEILRQAGVVDAGGAGLLELVRGLTAAVTGEEVPEPPAVSRTSGSTRSTRSSRGTATAPSSSSRARGSTGTLSSARSNRSATR